MNCKHRKLVIKPKVIRATAQLRWAIREITNSKHSVRVLEQLWQSDTGEQEWREVPTV
jgi:hypothetical protein